MVVRLMRRAGAGTKYWGPAVWSEARAAESDPLLCCASHSCTLWGASGASVLGVNWVPPLLSISFSFLSPPVAFSFLFLTFSALCSLSCVYVYPSVFCMLISAITHVPGSEFAQREIQTQMHACVPQAAQRKLEDRRERRMLIEGARGCFLLALGWKALFLPYSGC